MIQHNSFINLYSKDNEIFTKLFSETKTLQKLSSNIIKLSKNYVELAYPDAEKVKGDLFEIFAECFFKLLSSDNRIGVYGYTPGPPTEDYGVDGIGVGMDENPLTVQVKFRSDPTTDLTQKDLHQFAFQSVRKYRVDVDTNQNMILFTNANGLHWASEKNVFLEGVKSIGNDKINPLINNNNVFWKNLNDMVQETINKLYDSRNKS